MSMDSGATAAACCGGGKGSGGTLEEIVRSRYGARALAVSEGSRAACCDAAGCCAPSSDDAIASGLYGAAEASEVPDDALKASLGCGNPTALIDLRPGETVLDLGSGGGIDVLLSAKRVGPSGFVYGLDMTPEMLALAERNRAAAGATNVKFLEGRIEAIPLPDAAVDVLISNCVINLSADKARVLREAFRVLRPGGRFAVSDVVVQGEFPAELRRDAESWAGCIAGALEESEYRRLLEAAGFRDVSFHVTRVYETSDLAGSACCSGASCGSETSKTAAAVPVAAPVAASIATASGRLVSAFVRAVKPPAV